MPEGRTNTWNQRKIIWRQRGRRHKGNVCQCSRHSGKLLCDQTNCFYGDHGSCLLSALRTNVCISDGVGGGTKGKSHSLHLFPEVQRQIKSEAILFGPPNSVSSVLSNLGNLSDNFTQTARNLWVIFNFNISFDVQVKHAVQPCFFQLKTIANIRSFLPTADSRPPYPTCVSRFG